MRSTKRVACDPECLLMNATLTCTGPGPDKCTACANYKDGPHCVPRCPQGVPGEKDILIWKYADEIHVCQSCHENCTQGIRAHHGEHVQTPHRKTFWLSRDILL
ncbi:epidermal growth factor receptor-like [Pimephales promelas]|uniref:epidermal growth factor receptor-like n=1 Tax=Pimephales promelas TaxID=90988 RepID=UPI001955F03E|nr:epidermal growth factor receptor-like [Pimephales promelas]